MLDSEGQFGRRIPVTEEGDSDILKKIDEHFGTGSKIDAADDKELAVK